MSDDFYALKITGTPDAYVIEVAYEIDDGELKPEDDFLGDDGEKNGRL